MFNLSLSNDKQNLLPEATQVNMEIKGWSHNNFNNFNFKCVFSLEDLSIEWWNHTQKKQVIWDLLFLKEVIISQALG